MTRKASKLEAFHSLLGQTPDSTNVSASFPETIQLPPVVHTTSMEAVEMSRENQYEHGVDFSLGPDGWEAGRMILGEKPDLDELNRQMKSSGWKRGHLAMHTHPPILDEVLERKIIAKAERSGIEMSKRALGEMMDFYKTLGQFPSVHDIRTSILRSHGSLGEMVSSDGSNFLWVKRTLHVESPANPVATVSRLQGLTLNR